MEFYRWKPEEYREKTYHLNPYQDGCYRRLIDHYMETRRPLPDNDQALARICGISFDDWMLHAASIVRAFFKHHEGKLFNKHCDEELDYQDTRRKFASEKAQKAAITRHSKNKKIDATSTHDECLAVPEYRVESIENREEKKKKDMPDWLSKDSWDSFKKHRKEIKKPMTEQAEILIIDKLGRLRNAGNDPKDVLEQSIIKGWQGVFEIKRDTTRSEFRKVI